MAQPTDSGKLTLPLMIVAFLAVVGFLYWLSAVSEPTGMAIAEEEEPAMEFGLGTFQERVGQLENERVRLPEVTVASRLSTEAFFIQLPDGSPYLLRLLPAVIGGGLVVVEGDLLQVTGTVHAMTDSVIAHWENIGVIRDPMGLEMAGTATSFLEVERAQVRVPEDPENDDPPAEG